MAHTAAVLPLWQRLNYGNTKTLPKVLKRHMAIMQRAYPDKVERTAERDYLIHDPVLVPGVVEFLIQHKEDQFDRTEPPDEQWQAFVKARDEIRNTYRRGHHHE